MRVDLLDLLRADTAAQERAESYGIDPTALETWLQDRQRSFVDPTADEAVYRADRDLARRRRARR